MVTVIRPSESLRNMLHYNENKVKQNVAQLIHSGNYPKDTELLGFSDKINRLEKQTALNPRTKVNAVHISINFDPSESLSKETCQQIADTYMQKIGFGEQPYLVYQHQDAGHPHLHVVTTNIEANGDRIDLHHLGIRKSEKARQEIEKEFKLVAATGKKQQQAYQLKAVNVAKVQYGKSDTRRAITNVLDHVLETYKYASIPELNAVLKRYNVMADRGSQDSRTYQHHGLVYRVLNDKGEKVGVPIKASVIYNKPTLKYLEAKFEENEKARQPYKQRVKNAIDLAFATHHRLSLPELIQILKRDDIELVIRQNEKGIVYGLTYVDHKKKCVFNGSTLGKPYSANTIQERCAGKVNRQTDGNQIQPSIQNDQQLPSDPVLTISARISQTLQDLLQPEQQGGFIAAELREEIKKRKRKRSHH